MEKYLRLQINPLLITIVGLEKVKAEYAIKDFKPIENIEQALFLARKIGIAFPKNSTPEEVCQGIVDFNNETGYIFNDRTPAQIVAERKQIALELGRNPNLVPGRIVVNNRGGMVHP